MGKSYDAKSKELIVLGTTESGHLIIECEEDDSNLKYYCPYCKTTHLHGSCTGGGKGNGMRVSHCHTKGSILAGSEYFVIAKGYPLPEGAVPSRKKITQCRGKVTVSEENE
jgi:hypothetical protein